MTYAFGWIGIGLLLQAGAGEPVPRTTDEEDSEAIPLEVVYLANEGFLLRREDAVVLIDAFVAEPYHGYPALSEAAHDLLRDGAGPFAEVDVALTSHVHEDHFQSEPARIFADAVPKAWLTGPPQVVEAFRGESPDPPERMRTVLPAPGERERLAHPDVTVDVLRLSHGAGRPQNLGHLIRFGDMTVLHVGDAEQSERHFAPYDLRREEIDVALLPFWYFGGEGTSWIEEHVGADVFVACHVPVENRARTRADFAEHLPEVVWFDESLEARSFLPRAADEARAR